MLARYQVTLPRSTVPLLSKAPKTISVHADTHAQARLLVRDRVAPDLTAEDVEGWPCKLKPDNRPRAGEQRRKTARGARRCGGWVNTQFNAYWRKAVATQPELARDLPAKREAFAGYVDGLARTRQISQAVAQRVTLRSDK